MGTENPFPSRTSPTLSELDGVRGRKSWGQEGVAVDPILYYGMDPRNRWEL